MLSIRNINRFVIFKIPSLTCFAESTVEACWALTHSRIRTDLTLETGTLTLTHSYTHRKNTREMSTLEAIW